MENIDKIYEDFFNASPDLLCIAGYDGYFKKVNRSVCYALGYDFDELYKTPINHFIYQEDKSITDKVREQLRQAKPLFNFENRYVKKNGDIIWLSWTSLPIQNDELIFAIGRNITYKKKLEEERTALLTNLTAINKDLKQLNYTTSHDLRSPVNNLLSILSFIDSEKIRDKDTAELIDILKLSGQNLKQALDNYVDAISEWSNISTKIHSVNFDTALHSVIKSIHALISNSNTTLKADFEAAPDVFFNKTFMESIFLNLLTNSIKYARPGIDPEIHILSYKKADHIFLEIKDNGLGFDMEAVKDKIFGLHQNFHNHTDSKGVGLYLVYNHVTNLGGTIKVESSLNKGTKFTISFAKQ